MRGLAAVVVLASWAAGASAAAQDAATEESSPAASDEPSPAEVNARRVFDAGRVAFEAGRYEDALTYFEQAYELSHRPRLLYNIGVTADRLARRERAIEALEQYLASEPEAENRAEVETRLTVLRRPAATETTETTPADPTAGIVLSSIGGVLAAGGIVTAAIGGSDYASLSGIADGTTWPSIRDQYDRAPILVATGAVAGALGLAGIALGAALLAAGGSSTRVVLGAGVVRIEGTF